MKHPLDTFFETHPEVTKDAFCARADISRMSLWRLMTGSGEFSTKLLRRISEATDGEISQAQLVEALPQRTEGAA